MKVPPSSMSFLTLSGKNGHQPYLRIAALLYILQVRFLSFYTTVSHLQNPSIQIGSKPLEDKG